jgi:hypothetical protein
LGLAGAGIAVDIYVDRLPTVAEASRNFTGGKFEPRQGCLLGAYVDLDSGSPEIYRDKTGVDRRLPDSFELRTGRQHASYFFYLGYGRPAPTDWIALLGIQKRIVHVALEPNNGLEFVRDDSYLNKLAKDLGETQIPILLRFASEMNGNWLAWNGNPVLYKEKFRLVAQVMKKHAPNVAMVWCPYATPRGNIRSYYPGHDVVDWVGVNIYNVTYFNQDRSTPAKQIGPTELLDPIYNWYADRKPIMIGEYGATHFSLVENRSIPEFAIGCIRALYSALPRRYPRVKMVTYFNTNNLELAHANNNNYAVTGHPDVLRAYQKTIAHPWFLSSFSESQPDLKPQPMLLKQGDVLSGVVTLSGWAPIHRGAVNLRLKVNGRIVEEAPDVSGWQAIVDTSQFPNGQATISAQVVTGRRVTATDVVRVEIQN